MNFTDPFRLLEPLPASIKAIFLEEHNPPKLSYLKKLYYYLRPYIPIKLRHLLQSSRKVHVEEGWYISSVIIQEYLKYCSLERFNEFKEKCWPQNYKSALVMTHDVETHNGFMFIPEVLELESKFNIKSSWNIVPYLYPIDDGIIRLIRDSGCEIGIHGFNHDGKLYFSKRIFDERKYYINEAIKRYDAVGFRSPAAHRNLVWLQELDIRYDASCFDVDPFQPMPGGTHSIWPFQVGKFVELPYTLPQDHVLWVQLREKTNNIWERKIKWLYEHNGMMLFITHPDYLMISDNLSRYQGILEYLSTFKDIWNILPRDLENYWREKYGNGID